MAVLFGLMALRWLRGSDQKDSRRSRLLHRYNKIRQRHTNRVQITNLPLSGILFLAILALLQTLLLLLINDKNQQKVQQKLYGSAARIVVSNGGSQTLTFGDLSQHPSQFLSLLMIIIVQIIQLCRLKLRTVKFDRETDKASIETLSMFRNTSQVLKLSHIDRIAIESVGRKTFSQNSQHYQLLLITKDQQRFTAYETRLFSLISQQFIKVVAVLDLDLERHLDHLLQPR